MTKIFKNMAPYWYMIVAIVLLLIVQAFGDLSLPQYTSDIIDVGIQNKGVEHILPVKMTEDEYEISQLYMTSKEKKIWKDTYEKKGEYYICKAEDEEKLDQLDDTFLTAIFLNHNMSNVKESQFKKMIKNSIASNPTMAPMKDKIDDMSVDEIGKMLNMKFKSFQEEDDNGKKVIYVDVRPMLYQMKQTGMMSAKDIQKSREEIEKKMNDIGESTLFSTGVAYATKCDKAAGVDIDKIQTDYLWKEGGRMLGIAFMILVAAIGVGFLASKVGASVGRDLRGKIYKKVMGFSNAEMNRFSTASLITRSTNDIQQIQMVTAVMLRLLLYAPIIGIGGIIKVYQTGAGMEWIIALAVVVILGFVMLLVSIAMPKFKIMQTLVDGLNLVSREILTGLSVIRAFGREKTEEERFDEANKKLTGTQLFTNRIMTFMMPGMMFIMYSVTILITWVSAQKIDAGTLQVGAMTAFITYAMQIVMAFLMMTAMSIMVPRAGVAADRIDEVLKTDVIAIAEIITRHDEINVDFADVTTILKGAGRAHIAIGHGEGKDKVQDIINQVISSDLLETSIKGARRLIVNVTMSEDLLISDMDELTAAIADAADDNVEIIFGNGTNPDTKDAMDVTVIAADFVDRDDVPETAAPKAATTYTANFTQKADDAKADAEAMHKAGVKAADNPNYYDDIFNIFKNK